jgi:transposase InsO family protein
MCALDRLRAHIQVRAPHAIVLISVAASNGALRPRLLFSSLKTERTARKVYRTREQARADVFDYVERFYNPTRRHSTLGYVSPIEFEKAQEA